MATGLWTAVSGATAQQHHVDTVANNLANADTTAFKKDLPTFKEYLTTYERDNGPQDLPRGPIQDKEFYPLDGRDQAYVVVDGTYTNFRQGGLKVTKNPLDLALDGPGFFEVSTPTGIRYSRQGSLKVAMDGRLVTTEGYPVLAAQPGGLTDARSADLQSGQGGLATQGGVGTEGGFEDPALAARFISLKDRGANFSFTPEGELYAGQQLVAKLNIVEFEDNNKLRKTGNSLFVSTDPTNRKVNQRTVLHQGVLETSNVNPVEEMTNLIRANRMFEQDLKALKTYNDLLGREANDIGKL